MIRTVVIVTAQRPSAQRGHAASESKNETNGKRTARISGAKTRNKPGRSEEHLKRKGAKFHAKRKTEGPPLRRGLFTRIHMTVVWEAIFGEA
jgi:hypothetical protein